MGLGEGIADMNFRKVPRNERLKAILNLEINGDVKSKMLESGLLTNDLKQPLDRIEKKLLNVVAGLLILFNAKKPIWKKEYWGRRLNIKY